LEKSVCTYINTLLSPLRIFLLPSPSLINATQHTASAFKFICAVEVVREKIFPRLFYYKGKKLFSKASRMVVVKDGN
jgi:hypothetical protein